MKDTSLNHREAVAQMMEKHNIPQSAIMDCLELFESKGWTDKIENFLPVDKGMTNRLYRFCANGEEMLLRVAGEGSEYLVDREQEYWIYRKLESKGITDHYVYMNPQTGIKLTKYISNARCCDPQNMEDVERCMRHMAQFHEMKIMGQVDFDLFHKLEEYEQYCSHDIKAFFPDYDQVRASMQDLKKIIESSQREFCICHVDPVPDNFLIQDDSVFLIDWEYAAMGDPHMDVAMFCVYSDYNKQQVDQVIDHYFRGSCSAQIRRKIYCYIAVSGLLWTVWCEIKRDSGVLFEEYEQQQYRYAKDFYRYAMDMEVNT